MKKIYLFIIILGIIIATSQVQALHYVNERAGYILLQVEKNGEAWYIFPSDGNRYYLGRPNDAFSIMKKLALGAKHDYITKTNIFPTRLSGMILIDVDMNGEAYYIYPKDNKKYFLGRPSDAFRVMRELGQGITNAGLVNIPVGDVNKTIVQNPNTDKILQSVPFTSQAPFGGWSDQRQEDGCEEASALMAIKWAQGGTLTADLALKEILGASDYIQKKYGEYRDISTRDTVNWIIKDYFNYQNVAIKNNITIQDIVTELTKGNIIIVPLNGQLIHNPYFTPPGPPNHMLVIRGYDPNKKVFITNDPGTRRGEAYQYDTQVLYDAIRRYPTGYHELIDGITKDAIVVWK